MGLLSFGAPSFRHGVHPTEHKDATEQLPIEQMPFVGEYVLPLSQHIGAPSTPVVEAGDRVQRGQLIAEPAGFVFRATFHGAYDWPLADPTAEVETSRKRPMS